MRPPSFLHSWLRNRIWILESPQIPFFMVSCHICTLISSFTLSLIMALSWQLWSRHYCKFSFCIPISSMIFSCSNMVPSFVSLFSSTWLHLGASFSFFSLVLDASPWPPFPVIRSLINFYSWICNDTIACSRLTLLTNMSSDTWLYFWIKWENILHESHPHLTVLS